MADILTGPDEFIRTIPDGLSRPILDESIRTILAGLSRPILDESIRTAVAPPFDVSAKKKHLCAN